MKRPRSMSIVFISTFKIDSASRSIDQFYMVNNIYIRVEIITIYYKTTAYSNLPRVHHFQRNNLYNLIVLFLNYVSEHHLNSCDFVAYITQKKKKIKRKIRTIILLYRNTCKKLNAVTA